MVEFKFSLKKRQVWFLALLIIAVGFVIAQSPPNPGHDASSIKIDIPGKGEMTLQDAITNKEIGADSSVVWNTINADMGKIPINAGTHAFNLPNAVPAHAKEFLVFAWLATGFETNGHHTYEFYAQEGGSVYVKKFYHNTYRGDAWNSNSDNFWLPVTPNRKLFVKLDNNVDPFRVDSSFYIIGWR